MRSKRGQQTTDTFFKCFLFTLFFIFCWVASLHRGHTESRNDQNSSAGPSETQQRRGLAEVAEATICCSKMEMKRRAPLTSLVIQQRGEKAPESSFAAQLIWSVSQVWTLQLSPSPLRSELSRRFVSGECVPSWAMCERRSGIACGCKSKDLNFTALNAGWAES